MERTNPPWVGILKGAVSQGDTEAGVYKRQGLYSILLKRLKELGDESRKEIIPFAEVFGKLCRNFSISKQECWDILFLLRDVEIIEIVPFRGIRIRR
jgi:hypothetical protein